MNKIVCKWKVELLDPLRMAGITQKKKFLYRKEKQIEDDVVTEIKQLEKIGS